MTQRSASPAPDIDAYLTTQADTTLLRFIACGSVDDGKSTLIGRLLYEASTICDDQLQRLQDDSLRSGTCGTDMDFALLLDGLAAEREQGITIDVAYRYFSTARRSFIVADTPGHEQYTRNMATGASNAELAVLLVDARKGLLTQTRRHAFIASLLGIRHIVLAVNKMDLIGYAEDAFRSIVDQFAAYAHQLTLHSVTAIPLCAVHGDNIVTRSANTPWFEGPTLLTHLESVPIADPASAAAFCMPVQWVNRPNPEFRGFAGSIASGSIHSGDAVRVLPAGRNSRIARIVTGDGDLQCAVMGQSVTLTLADELDVSRGDLIVSADAAPAVADQFEATIVWLHEDALLQGRTYLLKLGTNTVTATVMPVKYKINVSSLEHVAAERLELNDIGVCELQLDRPIAFEPYASNRVLGGFILIDQFTNNTVGAGLLHFALRRSQNLHWQALEVNSSVRAALKQQRPAVLWLTGLSGAGKSTIANIVERKLSMAGRHTYLLDGDNVRHGLNRDLGFTDQDRVENIRRVAEVARLMCDAGLIVLVAFISPFRAERHAARAIMRPNEFMEIFVDTALAEAEKRDVKGLYRKARRGELKNFTGIDSAYEAPQAPELRIDTSVTSADAAADQIIELLRARAFLRQQ